MQGQRQQGVWGGLGHAVAWALLSPALPGILAALALAAQHLLWPPQDSPHQHKPHCYDPKDTQEGYFRFDNHLKKRHAITGIELQRKKSF